MKLSVKLQIVLAIFLVCVMLPAVLYAGTYEGVVFTAEEEVAVLDMANNATSAQLTATIGITATSANNTILARPISTMTQLAAVSYVGTATLGKLKAYVPTWTGTVTPPPVTPPTPPAATGGTYDLVVFSAAEEGTALTIANTATLEQLKSGGVAATPAGLIVNNRPWANFKAVSDKSGIATATMNALKNMVPSWTTVTPPTPPPVTTGGTYDGVVFTGDEEAKALDICNQAGCSQLRTVAAAARNSIYDKRPWANLLAVSNTSGIAATAMTALKKMTATWTIGVSGKIDTVRMLRTTPPALNTAVRITKCRIVSVTPNSTYMIIADANEADYTNPANQIRAYVPYGVGTIVESDPAYQWCLTRAEVYVNATYLEFPVGSGQRSLRWVNVFATHVTLP